MTGGPGLGCDWPVGCLTWEHVGWAGGVGRAGSWSLLKVEGRVPGWGLRWTGWKPWGQRRLGWLCAKPGPQVGTGPERANAWQALFTESPQGQESGRGQRPQVPSVSSGASLQWARAGHSFPNVLHHDGLAAGTAEPTAPTQSSGTLLGGPLAVPAEPCHPVGPSPCTSVWPLGVRKRLSSLSRHPGGIKSVLGGNSIA